MFVDCFSSLDGIPRKRWGEPLTVLRALKKAGRFSCWDVDGNPTLWATVKGLRDAGFITMENDYPPRPTPTDPHPPRVSAYPWTLVTITPIGEKFDKLGGNASPEGEDR